MPLVRISVPAGSLDDDKKTAMIAKVTDAVVEAEGVPGARQYTWVLIDEVPDGGWGMTGRTVTLAKMRASLGVTESAG
jgi:4-oxalocrotonate tautomerase